MDGRRERPVEDGIEKSEQSFVAAAGIVKGQAVVALDEKNLPNKPCLEWTKCYKLKFKLNKTK
ncbi:hypothetical protein [Reinekea sp. G2M2-21]|uniref:hypothetical protein n=1 Tax=Reinekea sp. G2M2-21 TaxID=2788942 RepID=UPI0018AB2E1F|nr:hypothetical protein [Reinekea sp. G2M2-21]